MKSTLDDPGYLNRWLKWQMTARNGRYVVSLMMKTSMVCRIIGYNGVPRWYLNLKWERRGLWWLDSRQDSEHNVRLLPTKAGKQAAAGVRATGQTQEKKRRGRPRNRRENGYQCGQLGVDNSQCVNEKRSDTNWLDDKDIDTLFLNSSLAFRPNGAYFEK
jgi:hypothetical protein